MKRRVPLAVLLIVGLLAGGGYWLSQEARVRASVRQDAAPMAPEIDECRKRLVAFHAAWKRFRDARGREPAAIEELIPRYVSSPTLLMCPTAARLQREGRNVDQGSLSYRGRQYPVTYGFSWLTASDGVMRKRRGEKAPLVVCPVHREVVSRWVYRQQPLGFSLSDREQRRLQASGATGRFLVVQRDGEIAETEEN